jgi:hypothetical protein
MTVRTPKDIHPLALAFVLKCYVAFLERVPIPPGSTRWSRDYSLYCNIFFPLSVLYLSLTVEDRTKSALNIAEGCKCRSVYAEIGFQ